MDKFYRVSQTSYCILLAITCLSDIHSIPIHRNDTVSNQNILARFTRETSNDLQLQNNTTTDDGKDSSKLQTFLVDSFSNIIRDIDTKVMYLFVDSMDEVFREVLNKLLPSTLDQIKLSLNNLQTDIDKNITALVKDAIADILDKKSSIIKIINQAKLTSGENTLNYKLIDTISEIFNEIEQPLMELVFEKQELGDSIFVTKGLNRISVQTKSTINDSLPDMHKIVDNILADSSTLTNNASLLMLKIVNKYLDNKELDNTELLSGNALRDLLNFTVEFKKKMVEGIDFLVIRLLEKTEDLTPPYGNLWKSISNTLKDLQRNMIETKMNLLKRTIVVEEPSQFEKSSVLKIQEILNSTLLDTNLLSNLSYSISELLHDSVNTIQVLFKILKNESENENNEFLKTAYTQVEQSLKLLLFSNECVPLIKPRFQNKSSSLDTSGLNEFYENILKKASEY